MSFLVFTLPTHRGQLDGLATVELGGVEVGRYPDGEVWARVDAAVEGRECALVGSLAPPADQMVSTLVVAHALRRAGAASVVAVLPYLGYARQDKARAGSSLGVAWAGSLLRACGVDAVVTVDIHSQRAADLLGLPVTSLSPAGLFAAELRDRGDLWVVAPDEGAVQRASAVEDAAGIAAPVAHLRKRRGPAGVSHGTLVGEVGARIVVVDDILDTGETLLSACDVLRGAGAVDMWVMATHGIFSGQRCMALPDAGVVSRIVVTDTLPDTAARSQGLAEVIGVAPLLSKVLSSPRASGLVAR